MSKDPAFLFYSKDFYEGTRMMLPEERACFIDLLVYQHQNGAIPKDLRRVLMYCSGVDKATLEATLEAKFKLTDKGWVNERLNMVVSERSEFKTKLSVNGTIGQFWKKCKAILTAKEYKDARKNLAAIEKQELFDFIKDKEINEATLKGLLIGLLKHYAIEDVNAIVNRDKNKDEELEAEIDLDDKDKIIFPFDSEKFKNAWNEWKDYKSIEHRFKYKTLKSEQLALNQLQELSRGESDAIKIIEQSIANGWKGLFSNKREKNGIYKPDARFGTREKFARAAKESEGESRIKFA